MQRVRPEPNPHFRTRIAIASDGTIYVNARCYPGHRSPRPATFVGVALLPDEVDALGPRGILAWAFFRRLAFGSDGRVYVDRDDLPDSKGRKLFYGVVPPLEMQARIIEEIHLEMGTVLARAQCVMAKPMRRRYGKARDSEPKSPPSDKLLEKARTRIEYLDRITKIIRTAIR